MKSGGEKGKGKSSRRLEQSQGRQMARKIDQQKKNGTSTTTATKATRPTATDQITQCGTD